MIKLSFLLLASLFFSPIAQSQVNSRVNYEEAVSLLEDLSLFEGVEIHGTLTYGDDVIKPVRAAEPQVLVLYPRPEAESFVMALSAKSQILNVHNLMIVEQTPNSLTLDNGAYPKNYRWLKITVIPASEDFLTKTVKISYLSNEDKVSFEGTVPVRISQSEALQVEREMKKGKVDAIDPKEVVRRAGERVH